MKHALLALFLLAGAAAFAQETHTYSLKPIEIAPGPRYFYGSQRLYGDFSALEVPFLESNDADVLRLYHNAKRIRNAERVVALVPLAYLLINGSRSFNSGQAIRRYYWGVLGGTIVVGLGLNVVRNGVVRRAVVTYNQRLPRSAFGVIIEPLPDGRAAPGVGLAVKF